MTRTWQLVTQPEAVRVFLTPSYLTLLEHLMLAEWTIRALADAAHLPLNATHHRVRRMVGAGLVRETRSQPRRGRPIRHYRASSRAYLIPYQHTSLSTLEELVGLHEDAFQERFHRAVVQVGSCLVRHEDQIGLRFFVEGDAVTHDVTPGAEHFNFADLLRPESPALVVAWGTVHLGRDDVKALQREMSDLMQRYDGRAGPERYLYRVGLVLDVDADPLP